jgi:regulator of protease activity HflC (stomatin/prohibitin superfamily)
LAVTVAPSLKDLGTLMRVGGWKTDAVARAAKELEMVLLGAVKGSTEQQELHEIGSDRLRNHLVQHLSASTQAHGLEIVSLTVASVDPANPQIAEAMRQREQARILEQAEILSQEARIAAAKARLKADEEIASLEHTLELRRIELKRAQAEKESALAAERAAHEARLRKLQLDVDKEELRLLKDHPELLLLTPQAARLAEASQSLKNARTVVSLSPSEMPQGNDLIGVLHGLLQGALETVRKKKST